jgi:uncharacterized protein (TIGR03437 family)
MNDINCMSLFCSRVAVCAVGMFALFASAPCRAQDYTITTVAGGGSGTSPATSAFLYGLCGVAVDAKGNLYIAECDNSTVQRVTPDGAISLFAGGQYSLVGYSGDGGAATSAALGFPSGVAVDFIGNVYISDFSAERIRKVDTSGIITTVAGGGTGISGLGDGGQATLATLSLPGGVAVDGSGNLFIADSGDFLVRKVATNGIITTVAGDGPIPALDGIGDGGPATKAFLFLPSSVAVDAAGNLYIADTNNNRIRRVATNGIITTVAGNGAGSYSGDGGPATQAGIDNPQGVAVDAAGNLYIADSGDSRIRMVTPGGTISTIAGNGSAGYAGDGGPANDAEMNQPWGIAIGKSGAIYVGDHLNGAVRLLTPTSSVTGKPPAVNAGGVVSASAFGEFTSAAPGSWIEIYGSNLAPDTRTWTGSDFNGVNGPESLDGTSVTIGGQSAFVSFISPGQVDVQVPSNVGSGPQPLIVTTQAGGAGDSYSITVDPEAPGLLAPPSFLVSGNQYVVALFPDNSTYVLPTGAIAGLTSRPAQPRDTIILYGVGFGPVTPGIPAGQLAEQATTLATPFHLFFGDTEASLAYDGLGPGYMGLYQFNVVVPNVPGNGLTPLTFTLGGTQSTQKLYIAVQ